MRRVLVPLPLTLLLLLPVFGGTAAAQQFPGTGSGVSLELFARPSLLGLNVDSTSRIVVPDEMPPEITSSRTTSPPAIGAGARIGWGNFGIEGSWSAFRSLDLAPFGLESDSLESDPMGMPGATGVLGQVPDDATAHLVFAQLLWTRDFGPDREFFVGLGAGRLYVGDPGTDRLLAGEGEEVPVDTKLVVFREPLVLGGSAGFGFHLGSVLLRPRLDLHYVRQLSFDYQVALPFAFEESEAPLPMIGIQNELQPLIAMVSVDIGFRFR